MTEEREPISLTHIPLAAKRFVRTPGNRIAAGLRVIDCAKAGVLAGLEDTRFLKTDGEDPVAQQVRIDAANRSPVSRSMMARVLRLGRTDPANGGG